MCSKSSKSKKKKSSKIGQLDHIQFEMIDFPRSHVDSDRRRGIQQHPMGSSFIHNHRSLSFFPVRDCSGAKTSITNSCLIRLLDQSDQILKFPKCGIPNSTKFRFITYSYFHNKLRFVDAELQNFWNVRIFWTIFLKWGPYRKKIEHFTHMLCIILKWNIQVLLI